MSVRGEFRRILGDTTAALRVAGEVELADALERAGDGSQGDLVAAATRVRATVEATDVDPEATDHLAAICRAILG